ncbi:MAG: inorganic phosphate transporter [Capsulimonas sp.]|uniref:inorganic phosphate transporter n=1 Tax=Capsulimonas sp. TaxID=2494211 RepID=UPI0032633CF7
MVEMHLPHALSALLVITIVVALLFDFTNGFHDTANAIATVVSTRVLSPPVAVLMCAVLNFAGAFFSTNVAKTIAKGLVEAEAATQAVILAAIVGAIVWNVLTWYFGIPSSSSHALIGGLVGAAIVQSGFHAVKWEGVLEKVVLPMVLSPIAGGVLGFVIMMVIFALFAKTSQSKVSFVFHNLQRLSAAAMSFTHGQNDAQKTMGVITLALVANHMLPAGKDIHIPTWVVISCATAMALGTASGGWRIIKTMGQRIIRLEPVHGFAAEAAGASVIFAASAMGMAVSTTHVISGSIFGVGVAKNLAGVRWNTAQRMVAAWCLTLPSAAIVAGACLFAIRAMSHPAAVALVK